MENMQEKNSPSRVIADCGVFSALSIVLLLTAVFVPILGTVALFVAAVPTMVLVMRQSFAAGILSVVVVTVVAVLLLGPISGIGSGIAIAGFGLVFGVCFKKKVSPLRTLFFGALAAGLVVCFSVVFFSYIGGISGISFMENLVDSVHQVFATYEQAGLLQNLIPEGMTAAEYEESVIAMIRRAFPAMLIATAMLVTAVNYIVASLIMRRLRYDIPALPPFREWHFPWWSLWGIIIALIAYLMGSYFQNDNYLLIAENILYVYVPICLISGIALATFFMHRFKTPTGLRVLLWVVCVFFFSFAGPLILVFGVFDIVVDYRKMMRRRDEYKKQMKP